MRLAVTEYQLHMANSVVAVVGAGLWAWWFLHTLRRRRDPLGDVDWRAADLTPVGVSVCLFAYLLAVSGGQAVFERLIGPRLEPGVARSLKEVLPSLSGQLAGLVVCVWVARHSFSGGLRGFGLRLDCLRRDIPAALAGVLMAFPLCWCLLHLCELMVQWWTGQKALPSHPTLVTLGDPLVPPWARAVVRLGPLLVAPVAEEVFFRGILQSFLIQQFRRRWLGIAVASAAFGGAHLFQPQVVLPLAALGAILGYVYETRGSLAAPVLLHALFNLYTLFWQAFLPA